MRRALRSLIAVVASLALLGLYAVSAEATSGAHFFKDTGGSVNNSGALVIAIDEAGVGQALVNYTLNWSGSATYACINGGGNHPKAANKATVQGGGATSFSESPINGRVQTTFTVPNTPPGPGSFACPSGQTLVLAAVSYTGTLTDTTNGVSADISASRTFFNV